MFALCSILLCSSGICYCVFVFLSLLFSCLFSLFEVPVLVDSLISIQCSASACACASNLYSFQQSSTSFSACVFFFLIVDSCQELVRLASSSFHLLVRLVSLSHLSAPYNTNPADPTAVIIHITAATIDCFRLRSASIRIPLLRLWGVFTSSFFTSSSGYPLPLSSCLI